MSTDVENRAPEITTGNNTPGSDPLGAKRKQADTDDKGDAHAKKAAGDAHAKK